MTLACIKVENWTKSIEPWVKGRFISCFDFGAEGSRDLVDDSRFPDRKKAKFVFYNEPNPLTCNMKSAYSALAALMLVTAGVPSATAQTSSQMSHSSMAGMKMSSADMNTMMSCKRMSKTALMKNKRCASMMKMHPAMMKMSSLEMKKMSSCIKMSHKTMTADKRCVSMMEMHHKTMMKH